jgi:hypothetical protein
MRHRSRMIKISRLQSVDLKCSAILRGSSVEDRIKLFVIPPTNLFSSPAAQRAHAIVESEDFIFYFFWNLNLYPAARTTGYRGGRVLTTTNYYAFCLGMRAKSIVALRAYLWVRFVDTLLCACALCFRTEVAAVGYQLLFTNWGVETFVVQGLPWRPVLQVVTP